VRLDATASPLADAMLLGRADGYPDLGAFSEFDARAWQSHAGRHEMLATVTSNLYFVAVLNGKYATDQLAYSLYLEIAAGGCPPALGDCSGHGSCSSQCVCDAGWEGLRCETPAPLLVDSQPAAVGLLDPATWSYFTYSIVDFPLTVKELTVSFTRTAGSSQRSQPLLVAGFVAARTTRSLAVLTSEVALFDYDGFKARRPSQNLTITRSNPSAQRLLYIGVHNSPNARAPAQGTVVVTASALSSMPTCDPSGDGAAGAPANATCRGRYCADRGDYSFANGQPFCRCDYGWSSDTRCASPQFTSFSRVAQAAQNMTYLCSVCSEAGVALEREGMAFYKVSQPLQKSTALRIDVAPDARAYANMSAANASAAYGNPSLLVAAHLPRSIIDFLLISTSPGANESVAIRDPSPTGQYWVAVYANTPGTFKLTASRQVLAVRVADPDTFWRDVVEWLIHSTAGYIVLVRAHHVWTGPLLCGCALSRCLCAVRTCP
jgi:hypothetical protein